MDIKFINNLKITIEFLTKNKNLMCTSADKGNISVLMRSEYIRDMEELLNDYQPRIQFTHEMERNNTISFLDLKIIKLDNGKIVSNWYRKSLTELFVCLMNHSI